MSPPHSTPPSAPKEQLGITGLKPKVTGALQLNSLWVIKVGSALLSGTNLSSCISELAAQVSKLHDWGVPVVLVSSGAVACGMEKSGIIERPTNLNHLQALSALGQAEIIKRWDSALQSYKLSGAQLLLTPRDLTDKSGALNIRNTLTRLLRYGMVPIINENDAVTTEELCFGDNDNLAGQIAALLGARNLVILTDQVGLLTEDPKINPQATLIRFTYADDPSLDAVVGSPSVLGRGGMLTKIAAARIAADNGSATWITSGMLKDVLLRLYRGEQLGTRLESRQKSQLRSRLPHNLKSVGVIEVDSGCHNALRQGRSLLPVGATSVAGDFVRGDVVDIHSPDGKLLARGLVNYDSEEAVKLLGKKSQEITRLLNRPCDDELVHRSNLTLCS